MNKVHAAAALAMMSALIPRPMMAQRVVHETRTQWQAARALRLVVEQRWCVDVDAKDCEFRQIDDAVALSDGGIVAADETGPLIRFSSNGQSMGALSRKGKGPAEYGFIIAPRVSTNDRLSWFDISQMRITSITLANEPGPSHLVQLPQTTTNLFVVDNELVVLDVPPSVNPGDSVRGVYRTVPASGAPRILATVTTPSVFRPGSDMRPALTAFDVQVIADVGAAGDVAHSNGDRFVVDVFPRVGSAWRLQLDMSPVSISSVERDTAIARLLRRTRTRSVADLPPSMRAPLEQKTSLPPLKQIRVLRDGTVWIRPSAAWNARSVRWEVFSRSGQRVGYAMLPASARVRDGTKDWVLVVETGVDDTPMVVKYKVGK